MTLQYKGRGTIKHWKLVSDTCALSSTGRLFYIPEAFDWLGRICYATLRVSQSITPL